MFEINTFRSINPQLVGDGLFRNLNIPLFKLNCKGGRDFFCRAIVGYRLYGLEKEKSLFATIIELKLNFKDEVKEFYKEDIEVEYPIRVPWKIYMRKQSRNTIFYHAFRQKIRIKDSGAIFLYRKIVPETLEEIFKNKKSQKRLWRDFFVKKNLSRDFFMSLQSQKVIPDIFLRYFLVEKLPPTVFGDHSLKKNDQKDFLRFFQREKAASAGLGEVREREMMNMESASII